MKAILINRYPFEPIAVPPKVDIIVDSAIVLPGRPLFLPDCAPGFKGVICLAFRVSRLGKNVDPKFASRYYDAVTLALRLVPEGWDTDTGALSGLFDNALAIGQWLPLADEYVMGQRDESVAISATSLEVDRALATVSTYATIKQGDIILPAILTPPLNVALGDNLTLTLNTAPCLTTRIR